MATLTTRLIDSSMRFLIDGKQVTILANFFTLFFKGEEVGLSGSI
jgi:hypothetical protein